MGDIEDAGLLEHVRGIIVLSEGVPDSLKSNMNSQFMVEKAGAYPSRTNRYGYVIDAKPTGDKVYVLFKPKSLSNYEQSCGKSHKCSGSSKCIKFPYSTEEQCQCPPGYDGILCNERSNTSFSSTLNTLMEETAKIPALSDVYFELQDTREEMQNGFADVGKALIEMKNFIGKELGKLTTTMNDLFKISRFQTRYEKQIEDMSDAIRLSQKIFDMFNNKGVNPLDRKDALEKAEDNRREIPKWELTLEKMFYGKSRFSIARLNPVMLFIINLYNKKSCEPKNKVHIDQMFRKFILLQSDLFALQASSLYVLGRETTKIAEKYNKTVADQVWLCLFLDIFVHFRYTLVKRKLY